MKKNDNQNTTAALTLDNPSGLGLFKLTAFAIGTTLASGVFSVSTDLAANGAGTLAVLIGWTIAGVGMYGLAMCFYRLSVVRPDLQSGIFSYAREGFGEYIGFNSAWGYWLSAMLSQVSFATLLFAAIGQFFAIFGDGNNLFSIICASAILWLFTLFILGGVQEAVTINAVIVMAKLIPIIVFIVVLIFLGAFDFDIFMGNFMGRDTGMTLGQQILQTTYTTVWIFTGIEGAVVISGRARNTQIAGRATGISFLSLLILYVAISLLSMGVMPRAELAALPNPPMAGLLASIVGPWGSILINIGVIISIGGAMFSYTILTADCAYAPAKLGCFPRFLARENKNGAPVASLLTTTAIVQVFLIIVYFQESTYQICYTLSTSAIMIPFFLSALYCLKLTILAKGFRGKRRSASSTMKVRTTGASGVSGSADGSGGQAALGKGNSPSVSVWAAAIIGSLYGAWMLTSTGIQNILISALLYGPGIGLYIWAKMERHKKILNSPTDFFTLVVLFIGFVISVILIANGEITVF
ncbi:MAG TPA: amino acid permease [Anaerovoracaceae bacterium]|nr:amino acid permease [Anaerovoracaceae bacterium]